MIPCIQTLGHSAMILRWRKSMGMLADTGGTLLVGEEETYRYIAQILKDASAPYRSRRIHIGMDESSDLGTGAYRARHGERPSIDVFEEHINRVMELTREQGLEPMIWSDMYFAHLSPTKDYDPEIHYPEEMIRKIPKDLSLVYWDYYHHSEAFYRGVIQQHRQSEAPVMFAGGLWNWCTPAVNEEHMLSTVLPALRACREEGVDRVFATAWGDDGAESVPLSLLYGLQVYAEFQYTGDYNEKELGQRFFALHKADPRAYLDLSGFDMVPKAVKGEVLAPNPAHFLLYEHGEIQNVDSCLEHTLQTMGPGDLFVTGANALDAFGHAALLIGSPGGGGYGTCMPFLYILPLWNRRSGRRRSAQTSSL